MSELPVLSVIVPCLNEEDNIPKTTSRLIEILNDLVINNEISNIKAGIGDSNDNISQLIGRLDEQDQNIANNAIFFSFYFLNLNRIRPIIY